MEVKIKGLKALEESLLGYLEKITNDEEIKQQIGEKSVEYIRASIQTGNDGYSRFDVSKGWAEKRADLARFNETNEFYKGSVGTTSGFQKSFNDKHRSGNLQGVTSKGKLSAAAQNRNTKVGAANEASNATFTGQLLASFTFKTIGNGINLFFDGVHKPYRNAKRKAVGNPVANSTIAEGLSKKRELVFISDKLRAQLESIIVREIRRKLSLYQKLSRKVLSTSDT